MVLVRTDAGVEWVRAENQFGHELRKSHLPYQTCEEKKDSQSFWGDGCDDDEMSFRIVCVVGFILSVCLDELIFIILFSCTLKINKLQLYLEKVDALKSYTCPL